MAQNTSSAVMAQRVEPHDSLDDFPTQPWATRALCEHVIFRLGKPDWNQSCPDTVLYRHQQLTRDIVCPNGAIIPPKFPIEGLKVWEPACNRGHMARPLAEYFGRVFTSDIFDYSAEYDGQERVIDFLWPGSESPCIAAQGVDWIISNPPFRLAEQFIARAREIAKVGVAMIVRTSFLEGVGRYQNLFSVDPPNIVAQFTERVPMVKGRLTADGSTATAYCWLVWMRDVPGTKLVWIPPCRKQLERAEDYR
jgi:hypothetical protein